MGRATDRACSSVLVVELAPNSAANAFAISGSAKDHRDDVNAATSATAAGVGPKRTRFAQGSTSK
jgi:hypothetical protein